MRKPSSGLHHFQPFLTRVYRKLDSAILLVCFGSALISISPHPEIPGIDGNNDRAHKTKSK